MATIRSSLLLSLTIPLLASGCDSTQSTEHFPAEQIQVELQEKPLEVASPPENEPLRIAVRIGVWTGENQRQKAIDAKQERIRKEKARKARLKRQAEAERRKEERRKARIAARTATTSGILGDLSFLKTEPITGNITTTAANIPGRTSAAGWRRSMGQLVAPKPDFITLNEVFNRSTESIQDLAPGYGVVRGQRDPTLGGGGQSLNNVVLYRADTWTPLASGMVKVVDDDRGYLHGKPFVWDRYATWALLKRADGAVVSVISTHMPTNPAKTPRQHGRNPLSRVELYAKGMDIIKAMEAQLSQFGPVILAGDMNSHPRQGPWTAVAKMASIGYGYTKDRGVMYVFHKAPATVVSSRQFSIASDHPALTTTLAMNGYSVR